MAVARRACWRQKGRKDRLLDIERLAKRKLMRMVCNLKGTELTTLVYVEDRRSRVLEYLAQLFPKNVRREATEVFAAVGC